MPAREEHIQAALTLVLDALLCSPGRYPGWCHTPNGAKRDIAVAMMLTGQGVKAGVPDVLIYEAPPAFPLAAGVAIELKTLVGTVKVDQTRWLEGLERRGWVVRVARGLDGALAALRALGWDVDGALAKVAACGWVRQGDRMVRASSRRAR